MYIHACCTSLYFVHTCIRRWCGACSAYAEISLHARMFVFLCKNFFWNFGIRIGSLRIFICSCICTHTLTHIHKYIHTNIHVHIHNVWVHMYACLCRTCMIVRTAPWHSMHTHIRTTYGHYALHTHTYIHTHTEGRSQPRSVVGTGRRPIHTHTYTHTGP
jgi:hypothetical protein